MNTLELLQSLSNAFGPSGSEDAVREVVIGALRAHVDELRVDALGNLHALKRGTGRFALRVMAAAHMDEVSLMITGIESDGTLRFRPAGGIDDRVLLGKVVRVGSERILGVIGVKPVHLLKANERTAVIKIDGQRIDIGAENKDAAARLVKPGDYAVFATQYGLLGAGLPAGSGRRRAASRPQLVKGKAFDDRAGCTVLVEVLRGKRLPFDLHAAFTVQEEIGLRGARVAAHAIDPHAAFVLEGTTADDLPKDKDVSQSTVLGAGPALTVMDRSLLADHALLEHVQKSARALHIATQFKQPGTGGTDGGAIHLARAGVPTAVISVPCRYIHSPVAVLDVTDLENTIKLTRAALERLTPSVLARES
jgi:putative aminopeptidase FrvX